jgi:hypothetical protein
LNLVPVVEHAIDEILTSCLPFACAQVLRVRSGSSIGVEFEASRPPLLQVVCGSRSWYGAKAMAEKRKGSDIKKRRRAKAGATDLAVRARAGLHTVRVTMGSHVLLVESTGSGGSLRLVGPDGAQPLEVVVGPEGAVLHLRSGLTVAVDGQLALRADAISLQAQTAMDISSGGSIGVRAEGDIVSEARAQIIRASAGDVRVVANDDVVMDGERIKLNC